MKKVLGTILAASLIFSVSIGMFTFADTKADLVNNTAIETEVFQRCERGWHMQGIKAGAGDVLENALEALVQEGVISQEKADSILNYVEARRQEMLSQASGNKEGRRGKGPMGRPEKPRLMEDLTDSGVVTSEEAAAIEAKCQELRKAEADKILDEKLNVLVENGTIKEEQKNSIKSFLNQKQEEKKAEMDMLRSMTEEERKAYFEQNVPERVNIIDEMIASGIITKEQAWDIAKLLPLNKQGTGGPRGYGGKNNPPAK
ncbi:MAG: hypothetical protein ACOZCL_15810 [Bacillota bacterium]